MSSPTLIYKPSAKPTAFNRESVLGFMIGSILLGPITGIIGAIIGGYSGKSRQQNEFENGKAVSPNTSFWNKTTAIGFGVGAWVGTIIAVAVLFTVPVAGVGLTALSLGILGGAAVGTVVGGFKGEQRQRNEYEHAKQWVQNNGGRNYHPSQEYEHVSGHAFSPNLQHQYQPQQVPQYQVPQYQPQQMSYERPQPKHHEYSIPKDAWKKAEQKMSSKSDRSTSHAQAVIEKRDEQLDVSSAMER